LGCSFGLAQIAEDAEVGIDKKADYLEEPADIRIRADHSQPASFAQSPHTGQEDGKAPAIDVRYVAKIQKDDIVSVVQGVAEGCLHGAAIVVVDITMRLHQRRVPELRNSYVHDHLLGLALADNLFSHP
jgi:hypothetical protein